MTKIKFQFHLKGGPGSGHHGHAGRPGKIGGSLPGEGGSGSSFDIDEWKSLSVPDRKKKWEEMPQSQRDRIVDAGNSIKKRIETATSWAGDRPGFSGDVKADIKKRNDQLKDMSPEDAGKLILETVNEFDDVLSDAGVSDELRYQLTQQAIDALYVQDNEAIGRTLGDHGIYHLKGDVDAAIGMLKAHPDTDTPEQYAMAYIAGIWHDAGYVTPQGHIFLDEGHPRWSTEHYNNHLRSIVEEAFGARVANEISHMIRTHDSTNINWEEDITGSALRVADNLALFQEEKLPGIFRYAPENIKVLEDFAAKKISISEAQNLMSDNIKSKGFNKYIENELLRGVTELSPVTPKLTLGMLAGDIAGFRWTGSHMKIILRRTPSYDRLQEMLDLGQKQFAKFAETYGISPDQFAKDLKFVFVDRNGNPLLESEIIESFKQMTFVFAL